VDKLAGMPPVHVVQRRDIKGCSSSSFCSEKRTSIENKLILDFLNFKFLF
jgi:hypothetical protein